MEQDQRRKIHFMMTLNEVKKILWSFEKVCVSSRTQLNISVTSLWRISRNDLALRSYNIALTQELKPPDHFKRRKLANWALHQIQADDDIHKKIIFLGEAHFWLDGFVNKQACRIWTSEQCEDTIYDIGIFLGPARRYELGSNRMVQRAIQLRLNRIIEDQGWRAS
nr:uncharacterized protein LOC111429559 [Onthophagus taurus]